VRASAESEPLIERGGVIFSLILSLGFNLLLGVSDLLGQGVLFNFVAGRYRRPCIGRYANGLLHNHCAEVLVPVGSLKLPGHPASMSGSAP